MQYGSTHRRTQRGRVHSGLVFAVFALIGLFFLLAQHRAHLLGWLPFLLLAACPLMHFLHHGRGGHGHGHGHGHGCGSRRPHGEPPSPGNGGGQRGAAGESS